MPKAKNREIRYRVTEEMKSAAERVAKEKDLNLSEEHRKWLARWLLRMTK